MPLVASLAWGRMAPLVLVLTYSLAAFGPLLVLQLAALVPFRVVEAVVELVTGESVVGGGADHRTRVGPAPRSRRAAEVQGCP